MYFIYSLNIFPSLPLSLHVSIPFSLQTSSLPCVHPASLPLSLPLTHQESEAGNLSAFLPWWSRSGAAAAGRGSACGRAPSAGTAGRSQGSRSHWRSTWSWRTEWPSRARHAHCADCRSANTATHQPRLRGRWPMGGVEGKDGTVPLKQLTEGRKGCLEGIWGTAPLKHLWMKVGMEVLRGSTE